MRALAGIGSDGRRLWRPLSLALVAAVLLAVLASLPGPSGPTPGAGVPGAVADATAAAAGGTGGAVAMRRQPFAEYAVIVERNIFDRSRRPRARDAEAAAAPTVPAASTVLVGVTRDRTTAVAFFEQRAGGAVVALTTGGEVDGYTLESVTLDGVVVRGAGGQRTLSPGHTLTGEPAGAAVVRTAASAGAAPASRPKAAAGAGTDDVAGSVVERLRRRREQEISP
jgi:hypothetical protein